MPSREVTNSIRIVLDEFLPPFVRDSRWFMWPFFVLAYRRLRVGDIMDFKRSVYTMSPEEYEDFYKNLSTSVSRRRVSDLTTASIQWLLERIVAEEPATVADIGCGNGYLLSRLADSLPRSRLVGVDVAPRGSFPTHRLSWRSGLLPQLPVADKEFDAVVCTHVLEHVLDLPAAIQELVRITRKRLLIVVPRQRYYYFTLDEHVNFFTEAEPLIRMFRPYRCQAHLIKGDWSLEVSLKE